ncbi:MAG: glucose 1-dehydrogenase [Actinobacteria bacterium]|nr:glucose 1-dehydrogenase [Actinomycetota bacterium]
MSGGRLDGRVAIVTGGARGQGASHGELLAGEGARVVLADVLDAEGEATAARLRERGLVVEYRHLDVTSPAEWRALVEATEAAHGKLDVLVNNAGVVGFAGVAECADEEWERVLAVNQTGVFYGIRAAVPALRRAGGGSIVNTASVLGLDGADGYAAYIASKAAVIGLTKSVALTHGRDNIRANVICPGVVETPMLEQEVATVGREGLEEFVGRQPIPRTGRPEEVSRAVLYLASEDSSYVTGAVLVVDGGFHAG